MPSQPGVIAVAAEHVDAVRALSVVNVELAVSALVAGGAGTAGVVDLVQALSHSLIFVSHQEPENIKHSNILKLNSSQTSHYFRPDTDNYVNPTEGNIEICILTSSEAR